MAPNKKLVRPQSDTQQEEMTVVVLKFKGGSQSLQKGFDAVTQAIASLSPSPARDGRQITRPPAELPPHDENIPSATEEEIQDADREVTQLAEEDASATLDGPKVKKGPKYTFMNDFDLSPAGGPSLKDYCTERDPQSDNDKVLVASAWITKHGGAELFTGSHLFTCFRAMEWKPQVDMTQPLRKLKAAKSYFENPSFGKWKLTGIGMTAAEDVGK